MGYDRGDNSFFNQMEFYLAQNRKETGHHDHIPFNLKANGMQVFSVNLSRINGRLNNRSEHCHFFDEKILNSFQI